MRSTPRRPISCHHNAKIVTIWNTYGPYHVARVRALQEAFEDAAFVCVSHRLSNQAEYPFFDIRPANADVIVHKDEADASFLEAFVSTVRLLKKHSPDLILTCGYERPETLGAALYAKWYRKTCFLMLDNRYEDRPRNTSVELIKSWYLKLFNGYVYGGTPHRRYLVRLGVRCDRAVSGYDCVDNDTIASLASKLRKDRGQFNRTEAYVLCLGRLVEKKNWGRLLIAYRQYVDQRAPRSQPWKLVIAGEGPMRDAIERDIGHLGLSDLVRMTGQVDRFSEVVALHALAKVLVLASHHNEQWGLVVNEAMAASRPVLVSRECGCAEDLVCDGRNGFAFDPHSPSDLAEKLLWMHDHEGRLDEMGRAGYERIAEFSPERFAENIKTLFESRRELTQVRGRKRAQQDSTTTL